jgi:hypothetical protein
MSDDISVRVGSDDDALSAIARERRAKAEQESNRVKPSIIESVIESSVIYTFDTAAIPWGQFDILALTSQLEDMYKTHLSEGLDFSPLLKNSDARQLHEMDPDTRLQRLALSSDAVITWSSGRFPTSRGDFVKIVTIMINYETILVAVGGQSTVAEVVAQEVLEAIWLAAGVKKKWSELEKLALLTGYGTQTRIKTPVAFESSINTAFIDYLRNNMVDGEKFAYAMGRQASDRDGKMHASVALDTLKLRISIFNEVTGKSSTENVEFEVTRNNDYGKGKLVARSELPYDAHEKLVLGLFGTIAPTPIR